MRPFLAAIAQYPVDAPESWEAYEANLRRWLAEAADAGAALAVFPEYAGMELAHLDPATRSSLAGSLAFVAGLEGPVAALHAAIARETGLHILAGSMPVAVAGGTDGKSAFVNRARLFAPDGRSGWQDKLVMTRFEAEQWGISAGQGLRLFDTALGRIGIATCYDSEFPLIARALAEAGAELLLVPSCTDTRHGFHRVRIGCQARALENQLTVIQAPLVGLAPWSPAVDENHGAAAVLVPPDGDCPPDGIAAQGAYDAPQWLFAEIDPARVARLRATGRVFNHRDWVRQPGAGALPAVETIDLVAH